jgi:hypothetical protein
LTAIISRGLGWKPDRPDVRDRKFAFRHALAHEIKPEKVLPVRMMVPWRKSGKDAPATEFPVFDQGNLGSCTGNAGATFVGLISGLVARSRLALYYYARLLEGEQDDDAGAYIRDIFKVLSTQGACQEKLWPYVEDEFAVDPPEKADKDALKHLLKSYNRLDVGADDTSKMFMSCLASGYPFEIGFTVYTEFMGLDMEKHGVLNRPSGNQHDEGGHAVCVIGADREFRASSRAQELLAGGFRALDLPESVYIVRNSWGPKWGWNGNFVVDTRYFEDNDLADDAWTGRLKAV